MCIALYYLAEDISACDRSCLGPQSCTVSVEAVPPKMVWEIPTYHEDCYGQGTEIVRKVYVEHGLWVSVS